MVVQRLFRLPANCLLPPSRCSWLSHGAGEFRLATSNRFWAESLALGPGDRQVRRRGWDDIARKGILMLLTRDNRGPSSLVAMRNVSACRWHWPALCFLCFSFLLQQAYLPACLPSVAVANRQQPQGAMGVSHWPGGLCSSPCLRKKPGRRALTWVIASPASWRCNATQPTSQVGPSSLEKRRPGQE